MIYIQSDQITNEIINPLSVILSHVQYLMELEQDSHRLESLKWIEKQGQKIAAIISQYHFEINNI